MSKTTDKTALILRLAKPSRNYLAALGEDAAFGYEQAWRDIVTTFSDEYRDRVRGFDVEEFEAIAAGSRLPR